MLYLLSNIFAYGSFAFVIWIEGNEGIDEIDVKNNRQSAFRNR
jgi:hypothetical protein